jgi:hypothetical protein
LEIDVENGLHLLDRFEPGAAALDAEVLVERRAVQPLDTRRSVDLGEPMELRTFGLRVRRYTQYRNPPILRRKEAFLAAGHPLRAKFAQLTQAEEAKGLYADPSRIGTRDGWLAVLYAKGLTLRGHRLVGR